MMSATLFVLLLAACGDAPTDASATSAAVTEVADGTSAADAANADQLRTASYSSAVTFEPLTVPDSLPARYIEAFCRLYTEPSCVAAQKSTCGANLSFGSTAECDTFMQQTASTCTGLKDALAGNSPAVDKCAAQMTAYDCAGTGAMCSADGDRLDASGDCAEIAAIITACDPEPDTGI